MHFVDGQRGGGRVPGAAFLHPCVVLPGIGSAIVHDGGRGGRGLAAARVGVGLQPLMADGVGNGEFVAVAGLRAGQENLPHAGAVAQAHAVAAGVPAVEIAHHRHPAGIGRPHGAAQARHAVHFGQARAQGLARIAPGAVGQGAQRVFAELRPEGIGIRGQLLRAGPADGEAVRRAVSGARMRRLPDVQALRLLAQRRARAVPIHRIHAQGARRVDAQPALVRAQHGEGIGMRAAGKRRQGGRV